MVENQAVKGVNIDDKSTLQLDDKVDLQQHCLVETKSFVNARGQRLRYRTFQPKQEQEIKAVLVFHLGYREHLDRKHKPISKICEKGYYVFMMEPHGHGLSEPLEPKHIRFTTDSVFYYVDDYTQFIKEYVEEDALVKEKKLGIFVGGMSMGGQISIMTALREKSRFKGLVLCCPSIDVDRNWIMSIQEYVAELLVKLVPYNRLVPAVPIEAITSEPEVVESITNDEKMEHGPVAVKQGYHLLQGFKHIAAHEHELTLPIFVNIGTHDKVVSMPAIQRLLKNSSSKDVTLDMIKNGEHAMDQGKFQDRYVQSVTNWLDQHYH